MFDEANEDKRDEEKVFGDDNFREREKVLKALSEGTSSLHTFWAFASRSLPSSILFAYISISLFEPLDWCVTACRRMSLDSWRNFLLASAFDSMSPF